MKTNSDKSSTEMSKKRKHDKVFEITYEENHSIPE